MPRLPSEELANANAVFTGKVIVQKTKQGLTFSSTDPVEVSFVVSQVWKGDIPTEVIITTARDSASCGYTFEDGEEYLVYANGEIDALNVSLCSRTAVLANAEADVRELGSGTTPDKRVELEDDSLFLPIAISLGIIFGSIALYYHHEKRRPMNS